MKLQDTRQYIYIALYRIIAIASRLLSTVISLNRFYKNFVVSREHKQFQKISLPNRINRDILVSRKNYSNGAITNETTDISLTTMFNVGPEVSLNGSPTVSPQTAAL